MVTCGELSNRSPYQVTGWVRLRGSDRMLILQLTGQCLGSLHGQRFLFEVPGTQADDPDPAKDERDCHRSRRAHQDQVAERANDGRHWTPSPWIDPDTPIPHDEEFAWQQVGPVEHICLLRDFASPNDSGSLGPDAPSPPALSSEGGLFEDADLFAAGTVPGPRVLGRGLRLSWHGQNGLITIDLPTAQVVGFPPNSEPIDDQSPRRPGRQGDSGPGGDEPLDDDLPWEALLDDLDDEDDPFDLLPEELKQQFEIEAFETDVAAGAEAAFTDEDSWDDDFLGDQPVEEAEWPDLASGGVEGDPTEPAPGSGEMDDPSSSSEFLTDSDDFGDELVAAVPLSQVFDEPLTLPRPASLTEEEAAEALKTLLANLAGFGVAVRFCRHTRPAAAYRLLVDEICPTEHIFPELRGTQWVHTIFLSEYCPDCG